MRLKIFILTIALLLGGTSIVAAQDKKADEKTKPVEAEELPKNGAVTGDQIAESAILIYSQLRGRPALNQIRKTTIELGKMKLVDSEGKTNNAIYEKRIQRADSLDKEKIRFDQKYPNAEFALVYDGDKVFGVFNNSVFTPREDATSAFQNQIWHGVEALLRYKENGSKVELIKEDKIMGVDYYIVNVTDKESRKTKFYVSKKYLHVKMLEYEQDGKQYRRKFYDYNYAQGTLVPYRSVLLENDKQVEETTINTITFGPTIGDELFIADGG